MKDQCPICGDRDLRPFLTRTGVPVHQNLVFRSEADARQVPRGDLRLTLCVSCGFIFNQSFDPSKVAYGPGYDNTQTCSKYYERYLDDLVDELIARRGVHDHHIVEIGCGNGSFLRKLVSASGAHNSGQGIDPSYSGPLAELDGRLQFQTDFYKPGSGFVEGDVVICRHVLEHVQYPIDFLRGLRDDLAKIPHARVFFETPCVEWILSDVVFWDFFYEHCSYFSAGSLVTAFEAVGYSVNAVTRVFGDQYLWLEACVQPPPSPVSRDGELMSGLVDRYADAEAQTMAGWKERMGTASAISGAALWGAGAKGVTLANLIDADRELITCVVDVNPNKQGAFVAGSGHPIVDYHELPALGVGTVFPLNPNYRDEILNMIQASELTITLAG
ncbi:MAG: class I SAM-dependent methyltransferase [Thermodesulfobacteriota bacterium]